MSQNQKPIGTVITNSGNSGVQISFGNGNFISTNTTFPINQMGSFFGASGPSGYQLIATSTSTGNISFGASGSSNWMKLPTEELENAQKTLNQIGLSRFPDAIEILEFLEDEEKLEKAKRILKLKAFE